MVPSARDYNQAVGAPQIEAEAESHFVSNYPPYYFWGDEVIQGVLHTLESKPRRLRQLGIYVHIPFCRRRCDFCYFKIYTDKRQDDINRYLDILVGELQLYAKTQFLTGRDVDFVYFGGGTPSYLSGPQIMSLAERAQQLIGWSKVREISFEAEPGTLNLEKLIAIKQIGTSRLSLGIESFSDQVLQANNRAHLQKHVLNAYDMARNVGFSQINVDLIAGLPGETDASWDAGIQQIIKLKVDSVTIYQLETHLNTILYQQLQRSAPGSPLPLPLTTKCEWVKRAFEMLNAAGYTLTSAYTAVRDPESHIFLYRDALWHGADLLALGVASFGHFADSLYQNEKDFDRYIEKIGTRNPAIQRAYILSQDESLIRQLILQLKLGHISLDYFMKEFGVDIKTRFKSQFEALERDGIVHITDDKITLGREGLLRVDSLLDMFYLHQHGGMCKSDDDTTSCTI